MPETKIPVREWKPFMRNHRITAVISGSWKEEIEFDGSERSIEEIHSHQQEQFVEGSCSCGEEFQTEEELYQHIEEIREKQCQL